MRQKAAQFPFIALSAFAAAATAETIVLAPVQDNTLYESSAGSLSNGAGQHFFSGRTGQAVNSVRRGLIKFDIAGNVPAGTNIESVQLRMFMSRTPGGARTVALHRAQADWGEGTSADFGGEGSGAAATTGDATWIHRFFNTIFWSSAGGDFAAVPSASTSVAGVGFYTWNSTPALVADVQAWLDTPASNFGWIIVGDETAAATAKRFDSRQNIAPANRPMLTVTLTAVNGACCLGVGACVDTTDTDCNAQGATFLIDAVCDAPRACCQASGTCQNLAPICCQVTGGAIVNTGQSCGGDSDADGQDAACGDLCPNDPLNDIDGDGLCADVDPCPDLNPNDADNNGQPDCTQPPIIPAASGWGLVILCLALAALAKGLGRRGAAPAT